MEIQKWPASITLIRHAEPSFNKGKMELSETLTAPDYSDYDTPLSEVGMEQALTTGKNLSGKIKLPQAVYVSPFLRTKQTLGQIQEGWPELKDVKTIEEDRLREQEHGVKTMYPDGKIYLVMNPQQALLRKFGTDYDYREEGGESMMDVRDRTRVLLNTLIREHGGLEGIVTTPEDVLLVSHHLTIMATRANLERWDRTKFLYEDKHNHPINCGVTIYKGFPAGSEQAGKSKHGKLMLDEYNVKLY